MNIETKEFIDKVELLKTTIIDLKHIMHNIEYDNRLTLSCNVLNTQESIVELERIAEEIQSNN